ncbi:ABC transporter substrate-binding protein [Pseudomonas sp. GD03860]|uniref:ABC transporter substrate-binding protein n=1 Tax=Pseudomonas TaxID=286 RepID=UPI0023640DF6|nr:MULTISPECIES: ABC transporter substrate-binding protein [Pseudomonas]MDD2056975.1 ABC transporter substrate-binding protein [Pseudomonas putida]MDH0640254.1 ABC transporter substrate-binding protein [Pseudomonas sp. GD03860]
MVPFFKYVALCLVLLAPASVPALERPKLTLAVGDQTVLYNLPLTVALRKGYFEEQGLELEVVDFSAGSKALQALIAGDADVVSGAYDHTLRMQAQGHALRAFVLTAETLQVVVAVSSRTLPDYCAGSDLRGKKIGISATGSSTQMVANLILAKAGVRADEVTFVEVGTSADAVQALRSGQIDVIAYTEPVISLLEQQHAIRVIADTRHPAGTQALFGGPMPAGTLYSSVSFIEQNPRTIQALTNAMVKALHWLHSASADDVAALVPPAYLLGDPDLYKQAYRNIQPAFSTTGLFPTQGPALTRQALQAFDPTLREMALSPAGTWTNDFVNAALQAMK